MSVPARALPAARPAPSPDPRRRPAAPAPGRRPGRTPPPVRQHPVPAARPRRRSGRTPVGFLLFAGVLLGVLLFGLVTLNAYVAQEAFRVQELEQRIVNLSEQRDRLSRDLARRSAPFRLEAWARQNGLELAEEYYVIQVPADAWTAAGGAGGR